MKTTMFSLTVFAIAALLLSACAQQVGAQPSSGDAGNNTPQSPADVVIEVTTAPGSLGQPLGQVTPAAPAPILPDANGLVTLSRDAQGMTVNMSVGQSLLLKLGAEYTWEITVSDENVISRAKNITVVKDAQGVYQAHQPGTATISASGDPLCRQSKPACGMPSLALEFTIVVK